MTDSRNLETVPTLNPPLEVEPNDLKKAEKPPLAIPVIIRAPRTVRNYDDGLWEDALWVKADPKDIKREDAAMAKKRLAGAIVHRISEKGECRLRAFGAHATMKATWALLIARGTLATYGHDMYWFSCPIGGTGFGEKVDMGGLGFVTVLSGGA